MILTLSMNLLDSSDVKSLQIKSNLVIKLIFFANGEKGLWCNCS